MTITWALVADRSHAAVFANRGPGKGLELVEEIDHPVGQLRDHDLKSDAPGRTFDRAGDARHAVERHEAPHEHEARMFAKELARRVRTARADGRFTRLVIAAEPAFLGALRAALDDATRKTVTAELPKHLLGAGDGDLKAHLSAVMRL